ncbi:MAG TPA: hypothetical protein ENH28_04170 [Euryarchaeota archaeon]|nr:flagellar assembly protein J [archaeon BMS3Bbin15]HDL15334.1 hypothetical protein [Euryarchaeota archaeon]
MIFEGFILFAHRILGNFSDRISEPFGNLRRDLQSADIRITLSAYLSGALLSSIIVFSTLFFLSFTVIILKNMPILNILAAFILSSAGALAVFAVFIAIPKLIAGERKRSIEASLPYAVNHMATIAVSGVPPLAIFHSLARFERYGEVSREANSIIRDSETFGYDITEAIKRKAERTPSEDFRRLLIGMASGISTGGDLSSFLNEAANSITEKHKNMWKDVIERLGIYSEAYVTIFVAGPIFFIVMGSMMGLVGGGPINPVILMKMFIYLAIPAANIMYLLFIEATIPKME